MTVGRVIFEQQVRGPDILPTLRYIALALSIAVSVFAQNHPEPGSAGEAPVICTGCGGTNSAGEPNDGKPTAAYDVPLVSHVGRYVDSTSTQNIQHHGIRTVRAGKVMVNEPRNRVYLELGSAIGAYPLDSFFADKYVLDTFVSRGRLTEPMLPVGGINTGTKPSLRPNGIEKAARIDAFIYPEAAGSGWVTPFLDSVERLEDFDFDDRGYVYYQSNAFGWGIHQDDGRTDGKLLPFVVQVQEPLYNSGATLFTMKSGDSYYAYTSDSQKARLYDVTVPATPVLVSSRSGPAHWVKAWAKNDAAGHVAVVMGSGQLRVYTYAALITGGAPLVEHVPEHIPDVMLRKFEDVAFDELGNLWVTDSASTGSLLWKLSAGSYGKTTFPFSDSSFRPETLHTATGYISVAGKSLSKYGLELFEAASGTPQAIDTAGYFRRYYHAAPSGFAQPAGNTQTNVQPFLHLQNGLVYLFYSAHGLGDVYEIGTELRPPAVKIISISPTTGPPTGGTVVKITGRNFGPDAAVTFDGTVAATTFVSPTELTAVAPAHAAGAVTLFVTSGGQVAAGPRFTYAIRPPSGFTATGTDSSTVQLRWSPVQGAASYEVFHLNPDGTATKFGSTPGFSFTHGGRAPASAGIYYVRALDAAGQPSIPSTRDVATTLQFTDPIVFRGMKIRGVHLQEVRIAVNALRIAAGLPTLNWTSSLKIQAQQFEELRAAIAEARALRFLPPVVFTDAALQGVAVKSIHMQELMTAVK
jgi:hypothetical protein